MTLLPTVAMSDFLVLVIHELYLYQTYFCEIVLMPCGSHLMFANFSL